MCYGEKWSYDMTGGEVAADFNRMTKEGFPEKVTFECSLEMREKAHRHWGRGSVLKILNSKYL